MKDPNKLIREEWDEGVAFFNKWKNAITKHLKKDEGQKNKD